MAKLRFVSIAMVIHLHPIGLPSSPSPVDTLNNLKAGIVRQHVGKYLIYLLFVGILIADQSCQTKIAHTPGWLEITRESKPWTRWWWHGSAVTKEGITAEMEAYKKAGLGGLEITPIYG